MALDRPIQIEAPGATSDEIEAIILAYQELWPEFWFVSYYSASQLGLISTVNFFISSKYVSRSISEHPNV